MPGSEPPRVCRVCGDPLPPETPPGGTTCRDWADAWARLQGDTLSAEDADRLVVVRVLCQVDAALRDGRDVIGDW